MPIIRSCCHSWTKYCIKAKISLILCMPYYVVKVWLRPLSTSVLDGRILALAVLDASVHKKSPPGNRCIGGWVCPRVVLDDLKRNKKKKKVTSAGNRSKSPLFCRPFRNPFNLPTAVSLANSAMISNSGIAHFNNHNIIIMRGGASGCAVG